MNVMARIRAGSGGIKGNGKARLVLRKLEKAIEAQLHSLVEQQTEKEQSSFRWVG